jgi:hypothetical protein
MIIYKLDHVLDFEQPPCKEELLCVLVVRVPSYRSKGPWYDSRIYHMFREVTDLELGAPSLVRIIEELLERKSNDCGLENRH